MFGSKDNEIVEMKTGPLNVYYVDCITEKRKKNNKYNAGHDIMVAIHSDANEAEFKKLFDEFIAENRDFQRWKFQLYLSKNGFYSFSTASYEIKYFHIKSFKSNNHHTII